MYILITSMNGDTKIIESSRITSSPPTQIKKSNQISHEMNIYQSNTYRRNLCWIHFENDPKVQER